MTERTNEVQVLMEILANLQCEKVSAISPYFTPYDAESWVAYRVGVLLWNVPTIQKFDEMYD